MFCFHAYRSCYLDATTSPLRRHQPIPTIFLSYPNLSQMILIFSSVSIMLRSNASRPYPISKSTRCTPPPPDEPFCWYGRVKHLCNSCNTQPSSFRALLACEYPLRPRSHISWKTISQSIQQVGWTRFEGYRCLTCDYLHWCDWPLFMRLCGFDRWSFSSTISLKQPHWQPTTNPWGSDSLAKWIDFCF